MQYHISRCIIDRADGPKDNETRRWVLCTRLVLPSILLLDLEECPISLSLWQYPWTLSTFSVFILFFHLSRALRCDSRLNTSPKCCFCSFLISYSTLCHDSQRGNDINLISTEAANYLLEDISLTTTTQRPYWSLIIMFQRVMHCSRTISERNPNLPMEFGHVVSEYQRTLLPPNSLVTKDLSSVGR